MIGIAVGRSTKTNTLSIYSPATKQYYEPDTYKFDSAVSPAPSGPPGSTTTAIYMLTCTDTTTRTSQSHILPALFSKSLPLTTTTANTPPP